MSDHAHFKNHVIGMKIVSTSDMYDRYIITCIKKYDNNNKIWILKNTRYKYWNSTGLRNQEEKNHKNEFNKWSNVDKGGKHTNDIKKGKCDSNVQQSN